MASNKVSSNELHHSHSAQLALHHHMQHDDQTNHHQNQYNNSMFSFGMMPSSSSATPFNISKESGAYESGYMDQALCKYLNSQDPSSSQDQRQMRQHSLSILPPQPLHGEPNFTGVSSGSKKPFEASNPRNDVQEFASVVQREVNCQGLTSEQDVLKPTDLKTLKRLAQNREAAKKSRLKKKAYVQELESHVQELESHKIELDQLKLEIQNDGAQGILLGGNANAGEQGLAYTNIIPGAAQFDKAYARWLEEHHHLTVDLRGAVNDYRRLNEIGTATRNWLAHCDQIVALKRKALKNDVFHVFTGMWKAPAERCFMWMGGFRPSAAIKIALSQMEGLTEQQRAGLRGLHQSTNEAEEAISGGFERLDQCLTQTIVGNTLTVPPDVNTYMTQMSIATKQVSALQGVVTQGDSLRLQTLQELRLHLTIRQAAQCFLVISEYFNRLRSLSTLWLNRTRHD